MQRTDPVGNVHLAEWRQAEVHPTEIPQHRERSDRPSGLLHVQPLAEGGLEQYEKVLLFASR